MVLLFRRGRLVRTARVMAVRCRGGRKASGILGNETEVEHQGTNNQATEPARFHSRIITRSGARSTGMQLPSLTLGPPPP